MKKCLFTFLFIVFATIGFSQNSLIIHSNDKGLYLTHTVQPKENFYSIGRLYNAPPKEIAAFNALDMAAGLSVGQTVQIPLTAANFSQTKSTGAPVYYIVGEKEGLYRVSTKNGKVLMADLRKWNNLTSDNLSTGQKLIVGFLQSSEAGHTAPVAKNETTAPPVVKEPEPKKEEPQPTQQKPASTTEIVQAYPLSTNLE